MAGRYDGPDVQTSVDIGDINLLNASGTKINPSTEDTLSALSLKVQAAGETALGTVVYNLDAMSGKLDDLIDVTLADVTQAASTAYVAADKVMPSGAVVKTTRAVAEVSIIDGDWTPLQTTINGDLRTRDDDANTTLAKLTKGYLASQTVAVSTSAIITLNASTTRVILTVPTSGIYYKIGGAASASTTPLMTGVHDWNHFTKAQLDTIQFYAAVATNLFVEELG